MLEFLSANIGTVIVFVVLAIIVCAIIYKMYCDKKKGKSSCGCNCGSCPMANECHK
ncbi:MAG: FeoB-associated Cys-rich membrane protein [Clostridia bacterium]|nr:FeoB-associated Cys-rich membrane protein [Clostridia bacterium]